MHQSINSEVVVMTGASAGVGRAVVREFAKTGAPIGLLARDLDGLETAWREIESAGGRALVLPTDLSDFDAVERAAQVEEVKFGPIGIWINNAMVSVFSSVKGKTTAGLGLTAVSETWPTLRASRGG